MSNTQNPIELLVKISADTAGSKVGLDKQLEALSKQLKSLEVPIKLDERAITALTNLSNLDFSKLATSMSTAMGNVKKEAKQAAMMTEAEFKKAAENATQKLGQAFGKSHKIQTVEDLKKQLQGLDANVKIKFDPTQATKEVNQLTAIIERNGIKQQIAFERITASMGEGTKTLGWLPKTITETDNTLKNTVKTTDQFVSRLNKLQQEGQISAQQFERMAEAVRKTSSQGGLSLLNSQLDGMVASNKQVVAEQEKQKKQLKEQADLQEKIRKLTNDIITAQKRNPKALGNNSDITSMLTTLERINPASKSAANSVKAVSDSFGRLKADATEAGRSSLSVMESFKIAMEKFPIWMASSTIFFGTIRTAREFMSIIVDLDSKLVGLKKVMDDGTDFEAVFDRATASAQRFGQSISEAMDSYIEFAKQGFMEDELGMLADAGLVASNVGDITAQKASEYMTSALVQWKLDAKDAMG